MKLIFILIPASIMAQSRQPSPLAIGGQNCGEIRLEKAFPNAGQYMAWRNCENAGEMSMELINDSNDLKAKFSNSGSGSLTLFNSSSAIGMFLSGLGTLNGYNAGIERVRITSSTPRLDLKDASGVNIARMDGTGTGGLFTSAGTDVTLSQTGDSSGGMSLILRNRLAENGLILANPTLDLADVILRGSTGTQRSIRLENRSGSGLTYLESAPEFQFGDMSSYPGGIGFMANPNGAGVYRGDYFQWMGGSSGYLRWSAPSTVTSYALSWPATAGATGDCFKRGSGTTTEWGSCGSGSGVDLTSAQDISGIKYATIEFRAAQLSVRATSGGGNLWQTFTASGSPITQYYPSTSGTPSIDIIGNRSSTNTGAIQFYDQSGNTTLNINGGSSSSFPSISLATATGTMVDIRYGGSLTGGLMSVYTNAGNQAVVIDGGGTNGRIRVSNGSTLQTGVSATVNMSTCTAAVFVMGIYTGGC